MELLSREETIKVAGGVTLYLPIIPIPIPGIPLPGSPIPGLNSIEFGTFKPAVSFSFNPKFDFNSNNEIGKNIGKF
ncbi:TPA: hypothetical protein ACXJRX_004754 [Serratia marcescens]